MGKSREIRYLSPLESQGEIRIALRQLGELAAYLNVELGDSERDFENLSKSDFTDFWLRGGRSSRRIDEAWNSKAANLVNQALGAGTVLPVSSEPKE